MKTREIKLEAANASEFVDSGGVQQVILTSPTQETKQALETWYDSGEPCFFNTHNFHSDDLDAWVEPYFLTRLITRDRITVLLIKPSDEKPTPEEVELLKVYQHRRTDVVELEVPNNEEAGVRVNNGSAPAKIRLKFEGGKLVSMNDEISGIFKFGKHAMSWLRIQRAIHDKLPEILNQLKQNEPEF